MKEFSIGEWAVERTVRSRAYELRVARALHRQRAAAHERRSGRRPAAASAAGSARRSSSSQPGERITSAAAHVRVRHARPAGRFRSPRPGSGLQASTGHVAQERTRGRSWSSTSHRSPAGARPGPSACRPPGLWCSWPLRQQRVRSLHVAQPS